MRRLLRLLPILACVWWPGCAAPPPGGPAPASKPAAVARTTDGKPDLSGVWQGGNGRRGTWEEANSGLGVGGIGSDPTAPPNPASQQVVSAPAPYQPWAAERVLKAYNRRGIDDPAGLCLPLGIPRIALVGLFPIQIVQTPTQIVMLYEYMSVFRVIPFQASHPDDLVPTYMGDSIARWDGDTLVVDTVSFNDKTWLTGTGTFHSDALHVTERYTRIDKDQINYDVTMDDPKVLTAPWTIHSTLMLRDGTRLREYVCAENNLDPAQYEKLLKEGVAFTR